jgi:hypothetical protein
VGNANFWADLIKWVINLNLKNAQMFVYSESKES